MTLSSGRATASEDQNPDDSLMQPEWEALRQLGHRIVDDMLACFAAGPPGPRLQIQAAQSQTDIAASVPRTPQDINRVYADFVNITLMDVASNIDCHPPGWEANARAALMALGAAALTPYVDAQPAMADVEAEVITWLNALLGLPPEATGRLTNSGALANCTALMMARDISAPTAVRQNGLQANKRRLTLYASREAHGSVQRAAELLGLGSYALRLIDVTDDFIIDTNKLELIVRTDLQMGYVPFCVVGNFGTTSTGAVDDLQALANLCNRYSIWLHIDGQANALTALASGHVDESWLAGLRRADSISLELHQGLHLPFEVACVLINHQAKHYRQRANALISGRHTLADRGKERGGLVDDDMTITRSRRAFQVWLALKAQGIDSLIERGRQGLAQADYLAEKIRAASQLELMAPTALNVVCFRYNPGHMNDLTLDRLNERLLARLRERGLTMVTSTLLHDHLALRCTFTGHSGRYVDPDRLLRQVVVHGRRLMRKMPKRRASTT